MNQVYAGSLGRGEEYDVLRTQLQEARWLIRSLEIRNETLLKVALTIVQRQKEFLELGEEHMRLIIEIFINTTPAGGRHAERVKKITEIEREGRAGGF